MALFGYARVSTTDQDLGIQQAALRAAGCQTVRSEKKSGTERGARTELQILLDFLREGDTLVVTRIDRLARSMKDLQDIVHELKGRGVALKATEQPIDTGTAAGKAFLDMLGVFAEFETNLRKERQAEGIAAAKARGVYKAARRGSTLKLCASWRAKGSDLLTLLVSSGSHAGRYTASCQQAWSTGRAESDWRAVGCPLPPRAGSG